jgi:hypothetical protein
MVSDEGFTTTDERVMGLVVTVMIVLAPSTVPLRVALTKIPTAPEVVPAVKVTVAPLPLSEPRVLLVRAQAYVTVLGHVELHVGVAVNAVPVLTPTEGAVGLTATEVKTELGAVKVTIATELCTVRPPRVPLTMIPTVPTLPDAVKMTGVPVVAFNEPIALLVIVQV